MRKLLATLTAALIATAPATAHAVQLGDNLPANTYSQAQKLTYTDLIAPGSRILLDNGDASCSVGWVATDTKTHKKGFITAGHCGKKGETVYSEPTPGGIVPIGTVEWNVYSESDEQGQDTDLMFVSVDDGVPLSPQVQGFAKGPSEVMDAAEYGRVRPDLCKVGYATGTTCGNSTDGPSSYGAEHAYFKAPSFEGDSGSPVFAQTRSGEIVAVGVLSGEMVGGIEYRSAQTLSKDLLRNLGVEVQTVGA